MKNTVLLEEMTWQEYASSVHKVLILPIGAIEQHGPHLPLNVDAVIGLEFAKRLAKEIDGVVAPPLTYGYKSKPLSGGGPLFPGTIDLNGATLQQLVMNLVNEFVADGFTKIFFMNAHFENEAFIVEAMDLLNKVHKDQVTMVLSNWWDPLPQSAIDEIFVEVPFPGWAFEHAAVTETSLMMLFAPHLVYEDQILDTKQATPLTYFKYPIDKNTIPPTGVLASAYSSSATKGQTIVDYVLPNLVEIVKEIWG